MHTYDVEHNNIWQSRLVFPPLLVLWDLVVTKK